MKFGLPTTLRTRLLLAFSLMQVLVVCLVGFYATTQSANTEIQTQRKLARNLMALAEPSVLNMLAVRDTRGLKAYLENLIQNTAIAGVFVSNPTGTVIYGLNFKEQDTGFLTKLLLDEEEAEIVLRSDLEREGISYGLLELKLSNAPLNNRLKAILTNNLLLLSALLGISLGITYWVIAGFTTPLKTLVSVARNLGRGNWQEGVPKTESRYDEIQELESALNEGGQLMASQIASLEKTQIRLQSSETQLRTLVNNMREALFELDEEGKVCFLNPAWLQVTGFGISESFGKPFSKFLVHAEDRVLFEKDRLHVLDIRNREMEMISSSERRIWVELDAHATFDAEGQPIGVVGRFQDVSQRVELSESLERHQQELYKISVTDDLTGLYNRRHFDQILADLLPRAMNEKKPLCLVLVDIDGFKFINDTYGHPTGDKVLKTVASLLCNMIRSSDSVARLAGDEFAVVLRDTGLADAKVIAESLLGEINQTRVSMTVGQLKLQASAGVAVTPTHGSTVQELVGAADVALYQAKHRGRGRVEVLPTDISQGIMEVFSRGFELRNALEAGNILPTFQPITDLRTGQPIAYEVLANMRRGDLYVPASEFIKVAEELGLVRDIDLHVIATALAVSPPDVELFLNISLLSFYDGNFGPELRKMLKPACDAGRPITIEITERTTLPLTGSLLDDLQSLRDLGCKLALDDFGHGYSTYGYLKRFRPEYLKIEGSFVEGIMDREADRTIVAHIHELATSFGAVTIAESIESEAIKNAVVELGIHCGQGFHYGRPSAASQIFVPHGSVS